ncbi:MAG: ATP-binding protein [bacterium]
MSGTAKRMLDLIHGLLAFSRITNKASSFVQVDLAVITHEVLSDMEVRIKETGGTIDVGPLSTIDADPLQMRQLLQNLIGNALKFRKKGEAPIVKIHGRFLDADTPDTDEDSATPLFYQLTVEDNGIGFDEKYTDRIFGVFQRLHSQSEYEGSGIGLSICRKIAERHAGSITVKSVPGMGSKFMVVLPAKNIKTEPVHETALAALTVSSGSEHE